MGSSDFGLLGTGSVQWISVLGREGVGVGLAISTKFTPLFTNILVDPGPLYNCMLASYLARYDLADTFNLLIKSDPLFH